MMDLRHAETRNMISASSFWYSTTCPHWRIQHEILGSKVWLKRALKIEQQRNNASQIAKCKQSKCKMQLKLNHSHLTQDHITKSSEKCPLHFTAIISRTPRNHSSSNTHHSSNLNHPTRQACGSDLPRIACLPLSEMVSNGKRQHLTFKLLLWSFISIDYRIIDESSSSMCFLFHATPQSKSCSTPCGNWSYAKAQVHVHKRRLRSTSRLPSHDLAWLYSEM